MTEVPDLEVPDLKALLEVFAAAVSEFFKSFDIEGNIVVLHVSDEALACLSDFKDPAKLAQILHAAATQIEERSMPQGQRVTLH